MSAEGVGALLTLLGALLLVAGIATMIWALYWPATDQSQPLELDEPTTVIDLRKPVVVIDLRSEEGQVWRAAIPASSSRRDE